MRVSLKYVSLVALFCTFAAIGCGSDNSEEMGASCNTSVDNITSPATGFATMHGEFFDNETVIIQETDGTVISQGTPDTNRNAFTLGDVPSGHHHYEIVISCDAGRDNLGGFDFDVD